MHSESGRMSSNHPRERRRGWGTFQAEESRCTDSVVGTSWLLWDVWWSWYSNPEERGFGM